MPSTIQSHNQDIIEGCREAIAALRALLAAETDPLKRYKFACALLRARPVKDALPPSPSQGGRERVAAVLSEVPARRDTKAGSEEVREASAKPSLLRPGEGALSTQLQPRAHANQENQSHHNDNENGAEYENDLEYANNVHRQADDIARRIMTGPDSAAALNHLRSLLAATFDPTLPQSALTESS